MVEILSRNFPGLTLLCEKCHALLRYDYNKDVYNGYVYCPICKAPNKVEVYDEKS